jgi:hypothetical protein
MAVEKFYVYFNFGSCNDGSHDAGLEDFPTHEEAQARALELRQCYLREGDTEGGPVMIQGVEVCYGDESA